MDNQSSEPSPTAPASEPLESQSSEPPPTAPASEPLESQSSEPSPSVPAREPLEKQSSKPPPPVPEGDLLGNINGQEESKSWESNGLDLFSHDSTHVRLVIEAERQTSFARDKAAAILRNLSMQVETGGAAKLEEQPSDKTEEMNQIDDEKRDEQQSDNQERDDDEDGDARVDSAESDLGKLIIDPASEESSNPSQKDNDTNNENKIPDSMIDPSNEDIENLKHCILPLSPSAVGKNAKPVFGKFEFKRVDSGLLAVVHHAMDDESKASSNSSKISKKSGFSWRTRNGSKKSGSSSYSLNESNALTDDAWMVEICEDESRKIQKKKQRKKKSARDLQNARDLPPRSAKGLNRSKFNGNSSVVASIGASMSDVDREEVISVVSNMSEISLESVGEKMLRNRSASLIEMTNESQRQVRIPSTLCLKYQVKMSKFGQLKRKISFNRGKASF